MKKLQNKRALLRALFITVIMLILFTTNTALAVGEDPEEIANNFLNFIFVMVRIIGVALLLWGVVQFGISLKSHDPSQRANALVMFMGGLIVALSREILNLIGISA